MKQCLRLLENFQVLCFLLDDIKILIMVPALYDNRRFILKSNENGQNVIKKDSPNLFNHFSIFEHIYHLQNLSN